VLAIPWLRSFGFPLRRKPVHHSRNLTGVIAAVVVVRDKRDAVKT
jgi:hypothetical protein